MSAKLKNSPVIMAVFERIAQERSHQRELFLNGQIMFDVSSAVPDPNRKLRVLTEEVGEVAQEIELLEKFSLTGEGGKARAKGLAVRTEKLRDELVQVAAVAVAWLESLEAPSGAATIKPPKCIHGIPMQEYCSECAAVMRPAIARNPRRA